MRYFLTVILLLVGFISPQQYKLNAQQGIPRTLSVQGVLTSAFGLKPLTGKQVFRVGIYESPLDGLPLHEQIDTVLVSETGLYHFSLGGLKGLPLTVKFDKPYFIDISVNGEKQNLRIPLQSAAYAFMAGAVESDAIGVEQLSPDLREKLFPAKDKNEGTFVNYVGGIRSVIAGGDENRTTANYASILGGFTNTVSGIYGAVVGGQGNFASGMYAFVGGGLNNKAMGAYTTVTAGHTNTISSSSSFSSIGGGQSNQVGGNHGTVAGGQSNLVSMQAGVVGGGLNNRSIQTFATVSGGQNNQAGGSSATISGGASNTATGQNAVIGGGVSNTANGQNSVIGGGSTNNATGQHSGIGSGNNNIASAAASTVSGGSNNKATALNTTISGGADNYAAAQSATVSGGSSNTATGQNAVVGGGISNTTSGVNATIGGGNTNNASGQHSGIGSGNNNIASGIASVVSGGTNNKATALNTTISGGADNDASAQSATVSGGASNDAITDFATIGGGSTNVITGAGQYSTISGGQGNKIQSRHATISGGIANSISQNSHRSAIAGGDSNIIVNTTSLEYSNNSVIVGGSKNAISNSNYSNIGSGFLNTVTSISHYSSIESGRQNTITTGSDYSSIGGGLLGTITSSDYAFIGSGINNNINANSDYSLIVGGNTNIINGSTSFVGGGQTNSITGNHGTIGGGQNNRITFNAQWSTIAGGRNNTVSADYSTASGSSNTIGTAASNGIAIGSSNQISPNATFGVALGNGNRVTGTQGVAIGYNNIADANAIAIGSGSTAAVNAMALGNGSTAAANQLYSKFSAGHVFEGLGTAIGNYVAQFYNPTTGGNGIKIKIANTTPSISNYFVNFENATGGSVGRITGQTLAEMYASNSYKEEKRKLEKERELKIQKAVFSGLGLIGKTKKAVQSGVEVIAGPPQIASATASSVATLGAGSGWTANEIARYAFTIVGAAGDIADALVAGYQEGQAIGEATLAKEKFQHWIEKKDAQVGVTYESGAADYAEWLPKQEQTIDFAESDIVGIHQGKIRYETEGAEQLMVVSSRPMILGNMPASGKEHEFEAVAFMGQVPVSVLGAVTKGDFILPSGGNHGLGIAVHPEDMGDEDFEKIVGIAWSDAPDTFAINKVNVAVGLQTTTLANQICKQSKEIAELKKTVRMIQTSLIAMSNNQSKTASISDKLDNIFYMANDQSITDSKPSLDGEKKISVHAMHKECLMKIDTMFSSNDVSTLQINTSIQSTLRNDPILKELYIYSIIQRLKN